MSVNKRVGESVQKLTIRYIYSILLFLLPSVTGYAGTATDSLLDQLNKTIEEAPAYDAGRIRQINAWRAALHDARHSAPKEQFEICRQLFEQFKVYKYDSAFAYARRMHELALQLNDAQLINEAGVKLVFVLLSSGMFKETGDYLNRIDVAVLPDSTRAEYYRLKGRYYYDLADYTNDEYFAPAYIRLGNACTDSALRLYRPHSFEHDYNWGTRYFKAGNMDSAKYYYTLTVSHKDLTWHQKAIATSSLGNIYIRHGKTDSAIALMARAAMADIRSSTKETTAMFILAGLLFKERDVKHASRYIEYAVADAAFYGARLRKVQVSAILPIIEGEKVNTVEAQKKLLFVYAAIVTVLLLTLVWLAVIILRQYKKLKTAQQAITEAHAVQQQINELLMEANKIKEEYIGYCFQLNSSYIDKMSKFKRSVEQKLTDNKYGEVKFLVNNIDLREEREELFRNFDRIFLKIFPQFVTVFNSFFREEDQIKLKDQELLNTDLRIFALIRIGINDNVKIAQILGYSVNTIYTYKTKIKNKALIPKEEFEERLSGIKAH
jgi:tetratricopeptide (TPR) repeat protein